MSKNLPEKQNPVGKIMLRPIVKEMEESYLSYAMSVIISRALPDARDGLKPVQRRILYAMWRLGLKHSAKFRKSATVVGAVLGKYHPHGDSAVYETMVRMAQDFSLRDPLIEGQGNFGSMDGDSAAAMRYTEARLAAIADEMMIDIDKETINWTDNYDGSCKEPVYMPGKLPQLLLNGTMGIAVGMATNIPPHNLSELVDGITHQIDHPETSIEELLKFIKGPDFPTGGIAYNQKDLLAAYQTGKGGIVTRAKTEIVENKSGYFQIIINEITYQTNKAAMIVKIANLVKEGKIQGIKDLRDESDKNGVRIVIDLKKDAFPKKILNKLYSLTELQRSFHFNMLALVDGIEPRILNLKDIIGQYISHRQNVTIRRIQFELKQAEMRAHILEGLKKSLDHINEVIETIKKSADKEIAHKNLVKTFQFSDRQAEAILEMKLQTLAGLERKKIEDELKEKLALIKNLKSILADPQKILATIKDELAELKAKYGTPRRTAIAKNAVGDFSQEDLIPNEETMISLTQDGYIKRLPPETFRVQKRGGKGVIGGNIKENDSIDKVLTAMTHDDLYFFTNNGKVFSLKTYEIPVSSRTAKGQAIVNFLQISPDEKITAIAKGRKKDAYRYLVMQTVQGKIKKTPLKDFEKVRRSGLIAINLNKDDSLQWVRPTSGQDDIILATASGQAIRFSEKQVRSMGRAAAGVKGIKLKKNDRVIGMDVIPATAEFPQYLVISENGYGKRTALKQYKKQSRGGIGIKTMKITAKTGHIVSAFILDKTELELDLITSSDRGQIIRTCVAEIPILGRATQGVRVMRLKTGEKVAAGTLI